VHRSRSVRRVEVTTDGRNLVSHAGTALLSELADRSGLTGAMSEAMAGWSITHLSTPHGASVHMVRPTAGRPTSKAIARAPAG